MKAGGRADGGARNYGHVIAGLQDVGDRRIFASQVNNAIRIRTDEEGYFAL